VLVLMSIDRDRLRWAIPTFLAGGALAGFWVIPFLMRLPYTNDMGWEKITEYRKTLHLASFNWLVAGAVVGAIVSVALRRRTGVFLTVMAIGTALAFRFAPQGRLWNARLLPLWFLWLWLLVGVLVGEVAALIAKVVRLSEARPDELPKRVFSAEPVARLIELATPVVVVLGALVMVGLPLRALPFGSTDKATGKYEWLGFESDDRSFVPDWVKWNYSGYEDPGKPRHDEYAALVQTMTDISKTDGCGRAMWEYESEEDGFGTPMALMLLPHWTDGCIGSMEGLFFESSATTPYHFLNQSELSDRPSRAQRDLPYSNLDVPLGIEHLKLLGVKYYMAITPEAEKAADADPDLKLLTTSGPWTVHYASGDAQRTWKIYEVAGSDLVAPLTYQPVVMTNVPKGGRTWLAAAVTYYEDPSSWDVPLAASGPKTWKRASVPYVPLGTTPTTTPSGSGAIQAPRVPIANPAVVSDITASDNRISFDVDQIGKPVLVKASYFPNWKATGAQGPYRVTPNQMVVIPTSTHVSLYYGTTPVDELGWLFSLAGLAGLVWLWRAGPVEYPVPEPRETASVEGDANEDEAYSTALERQLAGVGSGTNVDIERYFE